MDRDNASDLLIFLAVARERSFTRAAAKLGLSQSALSQIVRALEERLGVRLLSRTTRNVAPTQAGERLLRTIGPKFDEMDSELAALSELREKPAGNIRLTSTEYAAEAILMPALREILPRYPDIKIEVVIDYGLTNIVAEQYDAGIRPASWAAKDMIAVRVSPDLRMAVVGSPDYFANRKKPRTPQDLTEHNCLNLRLPTHGGSLYAWEFEKNGRELNVRVEGQLVFNGSGTLLSAAVNGAWSGLHDRRPGQAASGERPAGARAIRLVPAVRRLSPLLSEPPAGSPAFSVLVDALRYRGKA